MKKNVFKNKIIALAPMAGYTDSAFRRICREFGAGLVFTEMISAKGVVYDMETGSDKSLRLAKFSDQERPIHVQLFDSDATYLSKAAKIIVDQFHPEGININMGCPAKKVIKNESGAYLLKDLDIIEKMINSLKKDVKGVKLSIKTRLGWQDKDEIFELAKRIEGAGADMLIIHCRTKVEGFKGDPDWEILAGLKDFINIPIIVNGGIIDVETAERAMEESRADGLMIGQGAIGKPWIFEEIKKGKKIEYNLDDILNVTLKHIHYFKEQNDRSDSDIKKHLLKYFKGYKNNKIIKNIIIGNSNIIETEKCLEGLFSHPAGDSRDDIL